MAMMRYHARIASTAAMQLIYSARNLDDIIYRDELATLADSGHRAVTVTLTREDSPQWTGHRGRVDTDLLGEVSGGDIAVERGWAHFILLSVRSVRS